MHYRRLIRPSQYGIPQREGRNISVEGQFPLLYLYCHMNSQILSIPSVICGQTILQPFPYIPDVILQNGLVHCSQTGWAIKESWMGKRATRVPLQRRELLQLWKDHSRCEEDLHSRWAQYLQGMGIHKGGEWWESIRTNGSTLTKSWHSEIPRGGQMGKCANKETGFKTHDTTQRQDLLHEKRSRNFKN